MSWENLKLQFLEVETELSAEFQPEPMAFSLKLCFLVHLEFVVLLSVFLADGW